MTNVLRTLAKSIPGIVILLIVIEILWSNSLVMTGREVSVVDLKIVAIRQENEFLAQKVASASSLTTIAVKAKEMGLVDPQPKQFVMIGSETLPVALNRPQ